MPGGNEELSRLEFRLFFWKGNIHLNLKIISEAWVKCIARKRAKMLLLDQKSFLTFPFPNLRTAWGKLLFWARMTHPSAAHLIPNLPGAGLLLAGPLPRSCWSFQRCKVGPSLTEGAVEVFSSPSSTNRWQRKRESDLRRGRKSETERRPLLDSVKPL